ncbi:MAG: hypothetical protein RLZZ246_711 [Planctomycetota bacterium]
MTVEGLTPDRLLEDLSGRFARPYFGAIHDLYVALVDGNKPAAADARERLAQLMAETMGIGEVLGASLTLRAAAKLLARQAFAADRSRLLRFAETPDALPRVTFTEALQDMVERTPATIRNSAERTAQRIAELYSKERVVAFVMSAEASVTREAQGFISRALREGIGEGEAGRRLAMSVNDIRKRSAEWSEAYARMVFRTNVNTAVTAGRFRQAQDPDIRDVVPAFRFDAVGDSDTRDNHDAADGMILRVDNPAWNNLAPPLGYNCRCQVSHVSRVELELAGRIDRSGRVIESRIPAGAFPDPGFRHGGRPDLFINAGGR